MIHAIYTLPELSFIGGESQTLVFNLVDINGREFDASPEHCDAGFAIIHYSNKNGEPLLTKDVLVRQSDNGVYSRAVVELEAKDTMNLYGRYVYQLTIINKELKRTEIPGHGIIDITRNIHPEFLANQGVR